MPRVPVTPLNDIAKRRKSISSALMKFPHHYRIGQAIANASADVGKDPFFITDSELEAALFKHLKENFPK